MSFRFIDVSDPWEKILADDVEISRLRSALLSIAAFSKHPHPAPCGTDACVLCLIESACAEALGDSA